MPDNTEVTLSAVIALIQDTAERSDKALAEAFELHEKITLERDRYNRLQLNVMQGEISDFIREASCRDGEQKAALENAVAERRKDFAVYKQDVDTKIDDMKGDAAVVSARVDVLEGAPAKKALAAWKKVLAFVSTLLAGVALAWVLHLLGVA